MFFMTFRTVLNGKGAIRRVFEKSFLMIQICNLMIESEGFSCALFYEAKFHFPNAFIYFLSRSIVLCGGVGDCSRRDRLPTRD